MEHERDIEADEQSQSRQHVGERDGREQARSVVGVGDDHEIEERQHHEFPSGCREDVEGHGVVARQKRQEENARGERAEDDVEQERGRALPAYGEVQGEGHSCDDAADLRNGPSGIWRGGCPRCCGVDDAVHDGKRESA